MPDISFVIPCYNESEQVIHQIIVKLHILAAQHPEVASYEVILVDDGSTRTDFKVLPAGQFRLIQHKRNRGYGASLKTGIKHARYEWIGILDGDNTYRIEDFALLLPDTRDFDMVIGARPWEQIEWVRRPAKRLITWFASYLADYRIPDLNSGMRLFRRELVENHRRIYPDKFSFSSTLTMVGLTQLYEVKFRKIRYDERVGRSNIHPIKDPARFVTQLFRLAMYFRPLRIFIPLSALLFVLAIARGTRDVYLTNSFGGLALVLFFMSFQVFFFGLIAEIINKK